ncbi:9937_t:CDS:2 [Acaulospora colombiana]|uniref:9937_t:CDS:1 n=1 Tax=Acaulospora colombiana TaxID=27376 RepID=A0ACA9LMQ2_9GLOM|nr:9937_t:CDS:2 [Acaulospora colombiana]
MTTVKVLATGSANGKLNELFGGISKINAKYGPFDLLLCVGDLFADNLDEIDSLISGDVKVPITTYFMHGEHELPDIVKERVESNQGELCPNLFYLGQQGTITTTHGVKIAFVSGVMSAMVNDLPTQVDILLTHEWPKSITRFSSLTVPDGIRGSEFVASLVTKVKPRYHFAASEKISFQREPYQNTPSSNIVSDADDTQLQFGLPTWFVGLAEVGNSKSKWYYGFNLVPYVHLPPSNFIKPPENMTECPFSKSSTGQKRGFKEVQVDANETEGNFFWSTGESSEQANKRGRRNNKGSPPGDYVCNKCNLPGHWINECPSGRPRPPKSYTCKKCNLAGVSISHCSSFREIPFEDQVNLTDEVEKYKSALKKLFHSYGTGMVSFEISLYGRKNQHCHIQVVPVPLEHDSNKIREAFIEEASVNDLKLRPPLPSLPTNYFKVDFPDGTGLVHEINPQEQFDVQFGRKVLGKLLGSSHRINWRECELPEELERADAEKFKQAFEPYAPKFEGI